MKYTTSDRIKSLLRHIHLQEISNDTYYISNQYKEDTEELYYLKKLQKQEEKNK
ncbi:MAG: hypothetical protein IKW39_04635 [Alphaproteobacteria bacterium]|nr:hypothetical protein [Alphaproteobacteria bacterium]